MDLIFIDRYYCSIKMSVTITLYVLMYLANIIHGSTLTAPPQSAVVVAFEDIYDISLLANTLSDQGIDTTLIIPESNEDEVYETLIDVEVLTVKMEVDKSAYSTKKTIQACEALLKDEQIAKKIQEIQPTFTVFPALWYSSILLYIFTIEVNFINDGTLYHCRVVSERIFKITLKSF